MSDDREESMWYCPKCDIFVGRKLDECSEGHSPPWRPVRSADVPEGNVRHITRWTRLKAKLGWFQ